MALNRLSSDGTHVVRLSHRTAFDAFDEWVATYKIPPDIARAAWIAARDHWLPLKDRKAIERLLADMMAKFRDEEAAGFSSIEGAELDVESMALAIDVDPGNPIIRGGLRRAMDNSPNLISFEKRDKFYQRRLANGKPDNDTTDE